MPRPLLRRALPPLALALLSSAHTNAGPIDWLPEMSAHLEAARYVPSETALAWTAWIGAGAGLLRAGDTTVYGSADLETIIGRERRAFDAEQANYHLEAGAWRSLGRLRVNPFFHHVSRHVIDRPKPEAVDWNVLGLRVSRSVEAPVPLRLAVGVGHTTLASLVGYGWELTARGEADWLRRGPAAAYLTASTRAVTAERSDAFPRGGFVDVLLEAGGRRTREGRSLEAYVAFERRNDVFVQHAGRRDRGLIGFRVLFAAPE